MERKVIEVHLSHFVTELKVHHLYLLIKCKVHLSPSINHYAFGKYVVVFGLHDSEVSFVSTAHSA